MSPAPRGSDGHRRPISHIEGAGTRGSVGQCLLNFKMTKSALKVCDGLWWPCFFIYYFFGTLSGRFSLKTGGSAAFLSSPPISPSRGMQQTRQR